LLAACVFTCIGNLLPAAAITAESTFDVQVLTATAVNPTVAAVTGGSLDDPSRLRAPSCSAAAPHFG
jgi:hypothetical protein